LAYVLPSESQNRAELYRERVVELRARAEKFRGGTRSQLLILAEIWERLARIAESQYALIDSPGVDDVEPKESVQAECREP
jgi:hypothetical protein